MRRVLKFLNGQVPVKLFLMTISSGLKNMKKTKKAPPLFTRLKVMCTWRSENMINLKTIKFVIITLILSVVCFAPKETCMLHLIKPDGIDNRINDLKFSCGFWHELCSNICFFIHSLETVILKKWTVCATFESAYIFSNKFDLTDGQEIHLTSIPTRIVDSFSSKQ